MAGRDKNKHNARAEPPAAHHLMLGTIETLLNAFVELDEQSRARALELDGLIVRVKIIEPYQVFYLLFTREGIEVSAEQPGTVRVRVGGRLIDIASYVLGITSPGDSHRIRLWGDADSIATLRTLIQDFNLRTAAQRWVREHLNLDDFLGKLREHDPSWLSDLMPMPGLMRQTREELRLLGETVKEQQAELAALRKGLREQRVYDLLVMVLAFGALGFSLGGFDPGSLARMDGGKILLGVAGMALILSRLQRKV